jgi:hypothetical protein
MCYYSAFCRGIFYRGLFYCGALCYKGGTSLDMFRKGKGKSILLVFKLIKGVKSYDY